MYWYHWIFTVCVYIVHVIHLICGTHFFLCKISYNMLHYERYGNGTTGLVEGLVFLDWFPLLDSHYKWTINLCWIGFFRLICRNRTGQSYNPKLFISYQNLKSLTVNSPAPFFHLLLSESCCIGIVMLCDYTMAS